MERNVRPSKPSGTAPVRTVTKEKNQNGFCFSTSKLRAAIGINILRVLSGSERAGTFRKTIRTYRSSVRRSWQYPVKSPAARKPTKKSAVPRRGVEPPRARGGRFRVATPRSRRAVRVASRSSESRSRSSRGRGSRRASGCSRRCWRTAPRRRASRGGGRTPRSEATPRASA